MHGRGGDCRQGDQDIQLECDTVGDRRLECDTVGDHDLYVTQRGTTKSSSDLRSRVQLVEAQ